MKFKIALSQLNIHLASPAENYASVRRAITTAAARHADIIVLPEMWNTGYALPELATLADKDGETTQRFLHDLAQRYQIGIVGGSVAIQRHQHFFNTTYVFSRTGELVGSYDKVHLFGLMNEDQYLTAGQQENYFTLAGIPSASFICYDLRFPEWVRTVARHGAEVLYLPAEWPASRIPQWKIMLQSRAVENQAFVVAVNRVGDDDANHFGGHSLVVDPLGKILVDAGETEQIAYATIDPQQLQAVRGPIPVFKDRQPNLYH